MNFTKDDYIHYQKTNKQLWVDYQNGAISADYLQVIRFNEWSTKLNVPAKELNDAFLDAMAQICEPLPGAVELLNKLKPHARLGIITNGFARLQTVRLEHTGLKDMFEWLVISELVGIDTCWLQHPSEQLPEGITPTYTITKLEQLQAILGI